MNGPETLPHADAKHVRLKFVVSLIDGFVHRFDQTDAEANGQRLEALDPHKIFEALWMGFDSERGVTILPSTKVAHLVMEIDPLPAWSMQPNASTRIEELTRDQFDELLRPENEANLLRTRERRIGEAFEGVAVITVAGGDEILVRIQTAVVNVEEQHKIVDTLLGRSSIFFPCPGGFHFINTANITQIHVMPGQPHLAPNAWRVNPHED